MLSSSNVAAGTFTRLWGVFLRSIKTTRLVRESLRTSSGLLCVSYRISSVKINSCASFQACWDSTASSQSFLPEKVFQRFTQSQPFARDQMSSASSGHQSGKAASPSSLNPDYRSIAEADNSQSETLEEPLLSLTSAATTSECP